MPTYEYQCENCGRRFEQRQPISAAPLERCPECDGSLRRLISGGAGFILKNDQTAGSRRETREGGCPLEQTGTTCCGRDRRCGAPSCGEVT